MLILSIPFIIRASYTLVRITTDIDFDVKESIFDDSWLAPLLSFNYIIVADLIPITAQLSSMLVVIDSRDVSHTETSECQGTEDSVYYASVLNDKLISPGETDDETKDHK
uniref:Uncharacterized protein n=1 Tax=Euplotes harpa TaxID=151035 RepID=A0A7S3J4Z1_9SPIT|mmetsp:Transcript_16886/g.19528  ORF Transcript_16886/g.19528 Transcript_16886/m.19528 type:complete len:110 (+) Transcript_16886:511-840(+)